MPPGTVHHVATTVDSVAAGGHFFSSLHFSRCLDAVIVEHFVAHAITNTEHTQVHIVLFKLFRKYSESLNADGCESKYISSSAGRILFLSLFLLAAILPPAHEFASLLVFVAIIGQLRPHISLYSSEQVWHDSPWFAMDHGRALECLAHTVQLLSDCGSYQKRRILRAIISTGKHAQDLYEWGVATWGAQTVKAKKSITKLDLEVFGEVLVPSSGFRKQLDIRYIEDPDIGDIGINDPDPTPRPTPSGSKSNSPRPGNHNDDVDDDGEPEREVQVNEGEAENMVMSD